MSSAVDRPSFTDAVQELHNWAMSAYTASEDFWQMFADKVLEVGRRHGNTPEITKALSSLYAEFEPGGGTEERKARFEDWML